jgi:4-amino-4-deoxy-L-arabinose transferase-like glycosyltransferase
LLACSLAVMGGLMRAYIRRASEELSKTVLILFWAGFALGVLIKGPLILMFTLFPVLILSVRERSVRWLLALRPGLGLAVTALIVAPWFVAIITKSAGGFLAESVGKDLLGKVGAMQKQHWAPPGTYLLVFFATFWPGSVFVAMAAPFAWQFRKEEAVAFCLAWIIPSWLVFEAVPTKLPHYILPLCPALAIMAALALTRGFAGPDRKGARLAALWFVALPVLVTAGLLYAGFWLENTLLLASLLAMLLACTAAFLGWTFYSQNRIAGFAFASNVAAVALAFAVLGQAQHSLTSLRLSPVLANTIHQYTSCPAPQLAALGYREPSLIFLTSTTLDLLETPQEAAAFLQKSGCRLLLLERRFEAQMLALLPAGLSLQPVTRRTGFNINSGKWLDIGVYAKAE